MLCGTLKKWCSDALLSVKCCCFMQYPKWEIHTCNIKVAKLKGTQSILGLSGFEWFFVLSYCMFTPSLHRECTSVIEEQVKGSHLCVTCVSVCNWDQLETSNQCSFYELIKRFRATNINQSSEQELWMRMMKWSRTTYTKQNSWSWLQGFYGQLICK